MTNLATHTDQDCIQRDQCPAVELLIQPKERDIGDFSVRRLLPNRERRMVGPWIFFDHMGPADFPAGRGINVRPHPHINLATVTYLFEGEILHRDSLGSEAVIVPGDINLMVAGRGIVHSERERPEVTARDHRLHGLQLWLALPEADEETDPAFMHYPADQIPQCDVDGVPVRVMMGAAFGLQSPVKTFAETLYLEAHMKPGDTLELPAAEERAVYVASGQVNVGETELAQYAMGVLTSKPGLRLQAQQESRIAVIGGQKLGHRHIDWNFVSSRQERIQSAREDWRAQRFPKVPGDEQDYIPLPG